MSVTEIKVAPREMRRLVTSAVGRSFQKTLTEPITNSDSALKKQAGIAHEAGLVPLLLGLPAGERVDTSELRTAIPKRPLRRIKVHVHTALAGEEARLCQVIDYGPGMTAGSLTESFGVYASAKAKGERTRSLFGRGALDVLLYHNDATILSVSGGILSQCSISSTPVPQISVEELGRATRRLLKKHGLPTDIATSGTVVRFRLRDGTHVPQSAEMAARVSSFYMLRLIASDPNTEVCIEQHRSTGTQSDIIQYDFPVGTVLKTVSDKLNLGRDGKLPVSILVARADRPLRYDPALIERRENGLLFVDENDAVLDLTLLPEYDSNPYLRHLYGVVRIDGLRRILEAKLEAEEPEAVLSETRDGFNRKAEIAKAIFRLVEKHVKPIYEKEERRQRKGEGNRSEKLAKRVKDALKAINDFNNQETEEGGAGEPPISERDEAIYFAMDTTRLYVGRPRHIRAFVNFRKVKNGEVVLFESDNDKITVEPDSETVKHSKRKVPRQQFRLRLACDVNGEKGCIRAITLDKDGEEQTAVLKITDVDDPPAFVPPESIAFTARQYPGAPNRAARATLLVNLNAFPGMPEITFWLEKNQRNLTLGDAGSSTVKMKVTSAHKIEGHDAARVAIVFRGTAWGQSGLLWAKAKTSDGKTVRAKCRVVLERPEGSARFTDFEYMELERDVLADVAGDKIYVNAEYSLHKRIFGRTQEDFDKALEEDTTAQVRAAQLVVEAAVFATAAIRYHKGGEKGLDLGEDPITALRTYVEKGRMALEPKVMQALAPDATAPR